MLWKFGKFVFNNHSANCLIKQQNHCRLCLSSCYRSLYLLFHRYLQYLPPPGPAGSIPIGSTSPYGPSGAFMGAHRDGETPFGPLGTSPVQSGSFFGAHRPGEAPFGFPPRTRPPNSDKTNWFSTAAFTNLQYMTIGQQHRLKSSRGLYLWCKRPSFAKSIS